MENNNSSEKLSIIEIISKGTLIALLITISSLSAFGISWYFLDDFIQAAIIGGIVHFISLGFSFKISKKFFVRNVDS